jgi:hypothetical protein
VSSWNSLPGLLAFPLLLLVTTEAWGFCRQNSCSDAIRLDCPQFEEPDNCTPVEVKCSRGADGCINQGNTLYRTSSCLSYAVARGNSSVFGLTDDGFASLVAQAFTYWSQVDCGNGQHPGFSIQSTGLVTASGPYFCREPSLNTSTWFLTRAWTRNAELVGYETSSSSVEDGEVFDADVELNVDKILKDFPGANMPDVLLAIATHETGHFLGLAHSLDPKAVMYEAYSRTGLVSRPVTADDIAGICALFPPLGEAASCAPPSTEPAGLDEKACQSAISEGPQSSVSGPTGDGTATHGCNVLLGSPSFAGLETTGPALLTAVLGLARRRRRKWA